MAAERTTVGEPEDDSEPEDNQSDVDGGEPADFFERAISELEAGLPSEVRRKSALAEYGFSTPALILLALALVLLASTQAFGPGWLSVLINGKELPRAGGG